MCHGYAFFWVCKYLGNVLRGLGYLSVNLSNTMVYCEMFLGYLPLFGMSIHRCVHNSFMHELIVLRPKCVTSLISSYVKGNSFSGLYGSHFPNISQYMQRACGVNALKSSENHSPSGVLVYGVLTEKPFPFRFPILMLLQVSNRGSNWGRRR